MASSGGGGQAAVDVSLQEQFLSLCPQEKVEQAKHWFETTSKAFASKDTALLHQCLTAIHQRLAGPSEA
jgi:hypothetical protein